MMAATEIVPVVSMRDDSNVFVWHTLLNRQQQVAELLHRLQVCDPKIAKFYKL